jgi:hypothetical protein
MPGSEVEPTPYSFAISELLPTEVGNSSSFGINIEMPTKQNRSKNIAEQVKNLDEVPAVDTPREVLASLPL